MYIGHYAVAFGLKRAAPRTSLGLLVAAVALLDLIWPILVLAGIEVVRIEPGDTPFTPLNFVSYPYSHSLLFVVVWAALFAGIYLLRTRYRAGAVAIFVGVVSHWVLDVVSHRPDLPLYPGGARVGLGLWNSVAGTIIVESLMFAIGVWLYVASTRPRTRTGYWALWTFVVFLAGTYVANAAGPPPPGVTAVAGLALLTWVFPFWAWWIDRNRATIGSRRDGEAAGRFAKAKG